MASQGVTEQQIYDQAKHFQSLKTDTTSRLLRVDLSPEERVELENNQSMADTALKGLIPYIKNREESTKDYLDEIKNNPNNVGGQGFASMTENEEFQIGTWIDTGFLAGESKMVYDKDKGWGTYYKESPDVESKYDGMEFTIWGTQAANYLTTKVPTVDKSLQGLLQKAGVVNAQNKLTEAFMDINSPNTKVSYNKDGTIAVTTVGANWEAAAIAINQSVETLAETELLKDPKTANAVWRNVFQKEEDMKIGLGGEIDKDQKEEFINLLKIRAGRFIPNVDYVPGESEVGKQWTQENPNAFQAQKYSGVGKGGGGTGDNKTAKVTTATKFVDELLEDPEAIISGRAQIEGAVYDRSTGKLTVPGVKRNEAGMDILEDGVPVIEDKTYNLKTPQGRYELVNDFIGLVSKGPLKGSSEKALALQQSAIDYARLARENDLNPTTKSREEIAVNFSKKLLQDVKENQNTIFPDLGEPEYLDAIKTTLDQYRNNNPDLKTKKYSQVLKAIIDRSDTIDKDLTKAYKYLLKQNQ